MSKKVYLYRFFCYLTATHMILRTTVSIMAVSMRSVKRVPRINHGSLKDRRVLFVFVRSEEYEHIRERICERRFIYIEGLYSFLCHTVATHLRSLFVICAFVHTYISAKSLIQYHISFYFFYKIFL